MHSNSCLFFMESSCYRVKTGTGSNAGKVKGPDGANFGSKGEERLGIVILGVRGQEQCASSC